jgi:hypothetical protein
MVKTETSPVVSDLPELLTREQFAEFMGVHPVTADKWHRRRVGPPRIKFTGKMIRYRREAVLRWLVERESVAVR